MSGRGSQGLRQELEGVVALPGCGAQHRHQDALRFGAVRRAAAAPDFAVDHGGTEGLLGAPVRGVQPRLFQVREDPALVPVQEFREELVLRIDFGAAPDCVQIVLKPRRFVLPQFERDFSVVARAAERQPFPRQRLERARKTRRARREGLQ